MSGGVQQHRESVAAYALQLGDDALVLAQRLCEWNACAPTLEEDIALANTALAYLGRARLLLGFAGQIFGRSEDELAYLRGAHEFSNHIIMELPIGDFAQTMIRQYLVDAFATRFYAALERSAEPELAAIAAKVSKETSYFEQRSAGWVQRLGLGTDESHARSQAALDLLWPYTQTLFAQDATATALMAHQISVDVTALEDEWGSAVRSQLTAANFDIPQSQPCPGLGRLGEHSEHLAPMLEEMQVLQRNHPGAQW